MSNRFITIIFTFFPISAMGQGSDVRLQGGAQDGLANFLQTIS
jgi:hypothetical protein